MKKALDAMIEHSGIGWSPAADYIGEIQGARILDEPLPMDRFAQTEPDAGDEETHRPVIELETFDRSEQHLP